MGAPGCLRQPYQPRSGLGAPFEHPPPGFRREPPPLVFQPSEAGIATRQAG